jgi:hypothetical protein
MMELKESSFSVNLKVAKKKNVVVVGGGPAGCVAALAARRNGADTLLIERETYLGGNSTGALVVSFHSYRLAKNSQGWGNTSDWSTPLLIKGISLEVWKRLEEAGGTIDQGHPGDPAYRANYDPEVLVYILERMMEESRVDVLFNTFAFDAIVQDNVVKGVAIANKSGGQVILADVVVDASGDADMAAAAGVPFFHGREEDGRHHGSSLQMDIGGIDIDRYINYQKNRPKKTEEERKKLEEEASRLLAGGSKGRAAIRSFDGERYSFPFGSVRGHAADWEVVEKQRREGNYLSLPGVQEEWVEYVKTGNVPPQLGAKGLIYPPQPSFNFGWGYGTIKNGKIKHDQITSGVTDCWYDGTDQEEISKAIFWMRNMDWIYMKFLRERIPGFEHAYIIRYSPLVGMRESRRIVGEYTLTAEDCESGRRFPDVIAKGGRAINTHGVTGEWGVNYWVEPKAPYDVPFRCLVPQKVDNLLVAGRCISGTHIAMGSYRGQANCMSTGEAAGTAAALSAKLRVPPRKLDVKLLQKKLLDQGALLFLDNEKDKEEEILGYYKTPPEERRITALK